MRNQELARSVPDAIDAAFAVRLQAALEQYGRKQAEFAARLGRFQPVDQLAALALDHLKGRAVFKVKDAEPWTFHVVR